MDVKIDVTGERDVGIRFAEFPDALYADLRVEIEGLGRELLARIEARSPEKTGALRAAERLRIFADKTRITADVDVPGKTAAKAGALEYGAHRATKVSTHSMKLDHAWANKLSAPMDVLVSAYSRTPNIDEYAFERGPLHEMQPEVLARLNAVVDRAAGEANR